MTAFNRAGAAFGLGFPVGASVDIGRETSDDGFARARRANRQHAAASGDGNVDDGSVASQAGEWLYEHALGPVSRWLGKGLTWADHNIFTPATDGAQAAYRANYERETDQGHGAIAATLAGLLAIPQGAMGGLGDQAGALPDSVTDDPFYQAERERSRQGTGSTLAQVQWELWSLGDRNNRMENGRAVLPLIDDPEKWQERQEYFSSGAQKYATGFIDMATSLALDPTMWVGGAAGVARKGLTELGGESISAAAKASRAKRLGNTRYTETRVADATDSPAGGGTLPTKNVTPEGDTNVATETSSLVQGDLDPLGEAAPILQRLSPANRLKNSVERLSDYFNARAGEVDGHLTANAAKDPILAQSPEAGAAAELMRYVANTVDDEATRLNLLDQVQYAAMGDRVALQEIGNHSKRIQLDVERLMQPDDIAAREFIEASTRLTPEQKLDILNDEDLFKRQADLIREEMQDAIADFSRVEYAGTAGVGLENVGRLDAAVDITSVPLSTGLKRSWRGVGDARVAKTVQAFKSLGPVQFISGTHVPETLKLLDNEAPQIVDQYMREMDGVFAKNITSKDADAILNGDFRAEFAGARTQMDPGLSRSQRQNVLYRYNNAMQDNLAEKYAAKYGVPKQEVLVWIRAARDIRETEVNHFMNHARRAVDANSPLVYRATDGTLVAASPKVARAISSAQTQDVVAMIDWRKMDKMLRTKFKKGLVETDGEGAVEAAAKRPSAWAASEALLSEVNDVWKFITLLRPAYPMRVQMDTQARRLATSTVEQIALGATRGIKNGLGRLAWNQKRAPKWTESMYAMKFRAYEELVNNIEDQAYLHARGKINGAEMQALKDREAKLDQVLDMTPEQFRREMERQGKQLDEAPVRLGKTDLKKILGSSASMDPKTGKFTPPAWDDTYYNGVQDMRGRMFGAGEESVAGLLKSAHGRQLHRRTEARYPLVEYGTTDGTRARWTKGVIEAVNRHIRNDEAMMMMARGVRNEDIVQWMRRDPKGREYFQALNGNKGGESKWASEWELVQAQREHFDALVPHKVAHDTVLSRPITDEDVASWWGKDSIRPAVPVRLDKAILSMRDNAFVEKYTNTRDKWFRFASVIPEAYMGRHPMYHRFYKDHVARLAKSTGRKVDHFTSEQRRQITKRADYLARRDMARIMFDTSHKSNAAYHMRFLSPFYAAWEDTMRKWATIFAENPAAAPLMFQGFQSFTGVGAVLDYSQEHGTVRIMPDGSVRKVLEDGSLGDIVGHQSNPNAGRFYFQVPSALGGEWLKKHGMDDKMPFSLASFNAIFQGDMPFLPGAGPIVSVSANEMAKTGFPVFVNAADNPIVKALALPYGTSEDDPIWGSVPSWVKAGWSAISLNTASANQTFALLMQDELNRQAREEDYLGEAETMAKVGKQTRAWWVLRLFGTAAVPMSTTPNSRLDWYRQEYRSYQRKFGKDAETRFLADYPDMGEMTISLSANETGIAATEDAWAEIQPWRKEIAANPKIGWMFAGLANYGGDYSDAAYTAQKVNTISAASDTTFRTTRKKDSIYDSIQIEKGWREYGAVSTQINQILEERGEEMGLVDDYGNPRPLSLRAPEAADLLEIRDRFREELAQTNDAWAQDYDAGTAHGPNPVGDTLRAAFSAIKNNPEKVAKRDDLSALGDYLTFRAQIREELAARGVRTGFSSKSAQNEHGDLLEIWDDFTASLRQSSPAFEQLYIRARLDEDNLNSGVN